MPLFSLVEFHDIDEVPVLVYTILRESWFSTKSEVYMTIAFAGHATIPTSNRTKEIVKEQLRTLIEESESTVCYLGFRGDFDRLCAYACRELKQSYTGMELVYVTPYRSLSEQRKIEELRRCGLCDTSVYPPLEAIPPRFAISKRNEWMMKQADVILVYVNRHYGGAYQSLRIAKSQKKRVINICELP